MNLKNVFHILGIFVFLIGAAMLPPFLISAVLREETWSAIGLSSLVTMGTGILMYVFIPRTGERISLTHREGFVIVTLAWALASAFGGLPFLVSGVVPTFCDAYFETMSGFTTTGASVISNLDTASLPIPLIPPCDSEGSRHPVPGEAATPSERSDAGDFSSFS
jgi:trk system potassium uptake protein TrkH